MFSHASLCTNFFSFFSCIWFCFSFASPPPPPTPPEKKNNKWLARPIANMWKTRDTIWNESWSWHVIYTRTLSPTIALSWLVTWSESWSVLAHSLLVLVSFAAARARVTQCSPPSRVDVYLKPCPHYTRRSLNGPAYWNTHHLFGQKRINMQSAYIIFKMFSLRLKRNLRKPDDFKFTRFEAGICDERLPEVPRL